MAKSTKRTTIFEKSQYIFWVVEECIGDAYFNVICQASNFDDAIYILNRIGGKTCSDTAIAIQESKNRWYVGKNLSGHYMYLCSCKSAFSAERIKNSIEK